MRLPRLLVFGACADDEAPATVDNDASITLDATAGSDTSPPGVDAGCDSSDPSCVTTKSSRAARLRCRSRPRTAATCSAAQGCGQGQCVDACQAATLSKASAGCDFYTLPVDDINEGPGSCFAAFVANTWDRPVALTAEYDGKPLDISKSVYTVDRSDGGDPVSTLLTETLAVGQVAVVSLAQNPRRRHQQLQRRRHEVPRECRLRAGRRSDQARERAGSVPQSFAKGTCGYGRQAASSDGPFAITLWGMDQASSYGYVGGTGLRPINDAPKPVLK